MSHSLSMPAQTNKKLAKLIDSLIADSRLQAMWKCSNVMAIERLGFTDHGPTHVKIVANSSLKILRLLTKRGVIPSIVKDYKMTEDDAEVVVVLGSLFHDLGMTVIRKEHEQYGITLALGFLETHLKPLYSDEDYVIIVSEVLHAIASHEEPNHPLTVEAGIVKIADALDMEKGRARIPFSAGKVDIHSVSALSVEKVVIQEGVERPVEVKIMLSNSAGIFQIDELLKPRIANSGLQQYIHVVAEIVGESESRIVRRFEL